LTYLIATTQMQAAPAVNWPLVLAFVAFGVEFIALVVGVVWVVAQVRSESRAARDVGNQLASAIDRLRTDTKESNAALIASIEKLDDKLDGHAERIAKLEATGGN